MASLTFSVGSTAYMGLDMTSGRKALSWRPGAPSYDIKRFHPSGVDGQYIIRCGRVGRSFILRARHVGVLSDILTWMETDQLAYAQAAQTLIDPKANSFTGCNLIDYLQLTDPAFGRIVSGNRLAYIDVQMTFTWDGGI